MQSVLAVEELTGMLALHEAIPAAHARLNAATFRRWKHTLIEELARLAHALHDRRWFHKDFYLCHFFIPAEDTGRLPSWRGRVHLIDLHRLARHRLTWPVWLVKDLAELLYSSEISGVGASDRVRFWRAYRGAARRTWTGRLMRRVILFKWLRYRQHNARNKARRALAAGREKAA
jgi:heptose I phosphotransferase